MKTTQHMTGSYSYDLVSEEAARVFVRRSDVWWYTFPVDEEVLTGMSWHKGGAWNAPGLVPAAVADSIPLSVYEQGPSVYTDDEDGDRW